MNWLYVIVIIFSVLGAFDYIIGNKIGLGKEFEKGISMLGPLMLSMVGMLVLAPAISHLLQGIKDFLPDYIDPSIISSSVLANDMGGSALSKDLCRSAELGAFNGMVVSAMMGCTVSFTIPFALGIVDKKQHRHVILGILCGIVTIPVGCFIGGIIAGIHLLDLIINLIPLIIFSICIAVALVIVPQKCVKVFSFVGFVIKILVVAGLVIGIFEFLTGIKLVPYTDSLTNAVKIILNVACVMTGTFPLICILSKLLKKPLKLLAKRLDVNDISAMGFISSLATSMTTFDMVKSMDNKGVVLNSAFAVSGAFVFADHFAFTLAYNPDYILSVTVGKLCAGISAVLLAIIINKVIVNK